MSQPVRAQRPRGVSSRSSQASCAGPVLPTRRAKLTTAGPVSLTCDGVEVSQSIQNMAHVVPLVAKKTTVARVYLSASVTSAISVRGVLRARRTSPVGPWVSVPSSGAASINPAENGQLRAKRESETKSLVFILPVSVCSAGAVQVQLASVVQVAPAQTLTPPANAKRTITFVDSAPLRVRILGIRYQAGTPPQTFAPSALDFALIRSWLGRAYPVASVQFSQVTVTAPQAWPFDAARINAFIRGIRANDIIGGVDKRTHYFGLVSDGGGSFFMRGLASGLPSTPDPSTVASGPTGIGNFGWDNDGSYGDWYTGHELGHTFGRFHAEFCGAGGGAAYPFTAGQLSNADGAFVGLDVGDASHSLPLQALPGTKWHDVMTYCQFQWLSSFTYIAIRNRLNQENALPSGMPAGSGVRSVRRSRGNRAMSSSGMIHVVATLNLTRGTGRLVHLTPQPTAASGTPAKRHAAARRRRESTNKPIITVRVYDQSGRMLNEYQAELIADACRDAGDDETGSVDVFIPRDPSVSRLDLILNGTVLDTFTPGQPAKAVRNIRATGAAAGRARRSSRAIEGSTGGASVDPVITWNDTAPVTRAEGAGPRSVYSVQVSTDDGKSWQTVGFDLHEPQVAIDSSLLGNAKKVKVRITSTDGFHSATVEKVFKASDLV